MNTPKITWPYLTFPPVNLWTVVPAYWYYLTAEEKTEEYLNVKEEYLI